MKKNLAILINSFGSGGAERVVSMLLRELKEFNITLVLLERDIFYDIPKDVEVIYLSNSNINRSGVKKLLMLPIFAFKYKNILKDKNIKISLSFLTRSNYVNIIAKFFGSKAKTIISERNYFSFVYGDKDLNSFINKKLVSLYRFANIATANSKGSALDLERNYRVKNVKVIYNPIDIEKINTLKNKDIDLPKKKFTFITIGRLVKEKNHSLIIDAIKDMDVDLWIIGDGELKYELEEKIKSLSIEDRVFLLGREENPYKFLDKADAFVFASNYEGFPNVLTEALACKLPVVSTDCLSGPREILAPNTEYKNLEDIEVAEYGVLTPVGNLNSLKKAINLIKNNAKLREEYISKSYKRLEPLTIKNITKEWNKLLKES